MNPGHREILGNEWAGGMNGDSALISDVGLNSTEVS